MSNTPDWLPALVRFSEYGGDWNSYIEAVYGHFKAAFVDSTPMFLGKRVGLKRHPMLDNKEAVFWHMTSEGKEEAERTPDLRRCERVCWLRPTIEHCDDGAVRWWRNKRGGDRRVVLWLFEHDYVVVLAERGQYCLLWTAYCVSSEHTRRKLLNEYEGYKKG